MKLYAFDVGVYARAPLVSRKLSTTIDDHPCVVTRAVIQVFRARLSKSVKYFLENFEEIKQSITATYSRYVRHPSKISHILKFLEDKRSYTEDEILYTVLRAVLESSKHKGITGKYLEELITQLKYTHNVINTLDTLYFLIREDTLVPSIEHSLNHYLTRLFPKCKTNVGIDFKDSMQHVKNIDGEDAAILLSICILNENNVKRKHISKIKVLTTDHKLRKSLEKLQESFEYCKKASILLIKKPSKERR